MVFPYYSIVFDVFDDFSYNIAIFARYYFLLLLRYCGRFGTPSVVSTTVSVLRRRCFRGEGGSTRK